MAERSPVPLCIRFGDHSGGSVGLRFGRASGEASKRPGNRLRGRIVRTPATLPRRTPMLLLLSAALLLQAGASLGIGTQRDTVKTDARPDTAHLAQARRDSVR